MLSGQTIGLHVESNELLLEDPVSCFEDEEAEISGKVLYRASFEELARKHVQCDTVVWIFISLLLVLAWGIGVIMLLYLPVRRYALQKEISSRKLYVTPREIVYKATRPSFFPCLGNKKVKVHIPLPLIIDIIVEQGCLQSMFGIHTFRIECIARGKTAPVDELQFQGVSNPGLLRKVIIAEAARSIWEFRRYKFVTHNGGGHSVIHMKAPTEISEDNRILSPGGKVRAFPCEAGRLVRSSLLLSKLEEVMQSLKKLEFLVGKSKALVADG